MAGHGVFMRLYPPYNFAPYDIREPYDHTLDIVAIHGLGGDCIRTWTHENGTNWLSDLLPREMGTQAHELPKARVMSVTYDSEILGGQGKKMPEFVNSLLRGLYEVRVRCARRPIIFICHSLGGIVIKNALHQASVAMYERDQNPDDADLGGDVLEATKGILFLGTPHRGSDLGWYGYVAYVLAPLLPFFAPFIAATRPRADLIVGLRKDHHKLTQSTEDFFEYVQACRDSGKPVHFRSFYETRKLLGCIVVEDWSAVLSNPPAGSEHVVIEMAANHLELCKFAGRDDENYRKVLNELRYIAKA